jgi:hypothetical protein
LACYLGLVSAVVDVIGVVVGSVFGPGCVTDIEEPLVGCRPVVIVAAR